MELERKQQQGRGNQIHVSQVPGNEQFLSMEITKLPVGKQLIEAIATGPHCCLCPLWMEQYTPMLRNHIKTFYFISYISKCFSPAKHVPTHTSYLSFEAKIFEVSTIFVHSRFNFLVGDRFQLLKALVWPALILDHYLFQNFLIIVVHDTPIYGDIALQYLTGMFLCEWKIMVFLLPFLFVTVANHINCQVKKPHKVKKNHYVLKSCLEQ